MCSLRETRPDYHGDSRVGIHDVIELVSVALFHLQLLGRFGTVEEVGELCLFLAAEGTFLTGIDVPLSGGAELGYGQKSRLSEPVLPQ